MDVVELDDVWAFEFLVDLYFALDCGHFVFAALLHLGLFQHLHRHFFPRRLVHALVHLSESARAKPRIHEDHVFADSLLVAHPITLG